MLKTIVYILMFTMIGRTACGETTDRFDSIAKPFLANYCIDCHGDEFKKGGVAFHELKGVDDTNMGLWLRIWEQVAIKEMPPKKKDQPKAMARHRFAQWLISEFDRVKKPEGGFHKHRLPEKGNHVELGDFKKVMPVVAVTKTGYKPHAQKISPKANGCIHIFGYHCQMINPVVFYHCVSIY